MRIKIWANPNPQFWNSGPYKSLDIVEREKPHVIGDMTHYGPVIAFMPFADDESEQNVIVQLKPDSLNTRPDESVMWRPPSSYDRIQLFPIQVSPFWHPDHEEPPPDNPSVILETNNLTVEDVSPMIAKDTFSLWQQDCFLSRDTADALQNMRFAIVHRYPSPMYRDPQQDQNSAHLVNCAAECLGLIRPTRKSRAGKIMGAIKTDGMLDPQSFDVPNPAEVPEVQKLFSIRKRDIETLRLILPNFIQLYQKDASGKLANEYEPLRMAVQLYGEAYALHYWKARHLLWWSAIEALYGSNEDAAMARIYSFFGNKDLTRGFQVPIYEAGDIPSCYFPEPSALRRLGEMVPLIYAVRNASAHGQRVDDLYFKSISHPFGTVIFLEVLAEAVTFVIRKTVVGILASGLADKFKNVKCREDFWLYDHGLDKHQSRKRLRQMKTARGIT